jgi:hypothetical protein
VIQRVPTDSLVLAQSFRIDDHTDILDFYQRLRDANRALRCDFFEGVVMKRADSAYPVQLEARLKNSAERFYRWRMHLPGTGSALPAGMIPIVASAAVNIASNLVEKWLDNSRATQPQAVVQFAPILQQATMAPAGANDVAELKARLVNSPEVQAVLGGASPGKPLALNVSAAGEVKVVNSLTGQVQVLALSPATQQLAHNLGTVLAVSGAAATFCAR